MERMEKLIRWNNSNKYELLKEDSIKVADRVVYRIRALIDFDDVKAGDLGGYIESESNLQHLFNGWVYPGSTVSEEASVSGNAKIKGKSTLLESCMVTGDAEVKDSILRGYSRVTGTAKVDDVILADTAFIGGKARVEGVYLSGRPAIRGEANVNINHDVVFYSRVGSENGVLTAYRTKDNSVGVTRGCFTGSLEEFEVAVRKTHGAGSEANEYALEYQALVSAIKVRFNVKAVNVPGLGFKYLCVDK